MPNHMDDVYFTPWTSPSFPAFEPYSTNCGFPSFRVRDQIRSWTKSWWLKYAHRLDCRSWPLLIFWRRRDWRREVRMMLQILLHRLVAQHEPEPSLRGHIDGLLQIQFVQVNHVFD